MKINKIARILIAVVAVATMSSCHIYKKYETPTDTALTKAYVEARQQPADSAAFGNLLWEDIFTDPQLATLINQALANNTNLRNAQLNVEVAHANLKGARLAYLPSLTIAPNGAGASFAGSDLSWSYTIPAQLSWEIDIFGKLLNSKRGAQASFMKSEAYAQAVRSRLFRLSQPHTTRLQPSATNSTSRAIPQPYGKKQCRQCATSRKPDVALPKQP